MPVSSNHMIQIRRSPLQIQGSSQMKKVNIIVPISLGRLETINRFLRIWNDLFKQDKNQKLILSFSGTDTEHRNGISFFAMQAIWKLMNIDVKITHKYCRIRIVARFNGLIHHHELYCSLQ